MKIVAKRSDGALHLYVGAGVAVILKNDRVTPPLDDAVVQSMGPWTPAQTTLELRREIERRVDRARVAGMDYFVNLGMSFDERRDRVMAALRLRLGIPSGGYGGLEFWVPQNGMGEDWVVYCYNGRHFGMVYGMTDSGDITFEGNPVEVRSTWESLSEESEEAAEPAMDDEGKSFDQAIELRQTNWFKKFIKSKRLATDLPHSLPNLNPGSPSVSTVGKKLPSNY